MTTNPEIANRRRLSIARSLTVSLILTVVIVSAIAMGFNYFYSSEKAKTQLEKKADEYIKFLTDSLAVPVWTYEETAVKNIGAFFAKNELVVALRISDSNHTVFVEVKKSDENSVITKEQDLFHEGGLVGNVRLSLSSQYYDEISRSLLRSSATTILTVLASLIVMTGLLLRIFLRKPLDELSQIVNAYAAGKYECLGNRVFYSEFEPLVRLLEKMADEIQARIKELSEAEKKYRNIFENAVDGIFQTTPDGHIISANPALAKILGYHSADELCRSFTDITKLVYADPTDREIIIHRLNREGKVIGYETEMVRKDSSLIRLSMSAHEVRNEHGDLLYYEGFLTDITERIKREKAEREREVAEFASNAKSAFLANISHEIRTPMNAILGFSEVLKSKIEDPQHLSYLKTIVFAGQSLLRLINDILDLSKIEAGKLEFHPEPVSIGQLLADVRLMLLKNAKDKKIDLFLDIGSDLPAYLMIDDVRFREILINLVDNAIKYTHAGYIKLSARGDFSDESQTSYRLSINIEDTGIGIPDDQTDCVFEAFQQQRGQKVKQYGGVGLGLAITRRLVEAMGGTISVNSAVGKGSVFAIVIPDLEIAEADPPLWQEISEPDIEFEPAVILIADDIEYNRDLLKAYLNHTPVTILEAENGEDALKQIRSQTIDCVLTDLGMPGLNGYQIAEQIKKDRSLRHVPIIAMTTSGIIAEHDAAQALFDGWLLKPISKIKMIREMQKHLPCQTTHHAYGASLIGDPKPVLSAKAIENLPEIRKLLDETVLPQWKEFAEVCFIDDIADFAEQLQQIAVKYEINCLADYSRRLYENAEHNNVDGIEIILKAFPEIISWIKGVSSD